MKKFIALLLLAVVLFFGGVYFLYQPPADRFPAKTRINNIDVTGLTIEEAEKKITESRTNRDFQFIYNKALFPVAMKTLKFDINAGSILKSLTYYEKLRYFLHMENRFEVPIKPAESEEFLQEIEKLPFCDNTGKEKTTDAYVDLSDFEFRTVKEKIGTEVDPKRVRDIAYENITNGNYAAELIDEDMIRQPELVADSDEFRKRLQYCKDNLSFKLEYDTGDGTEVIKPEQIDKMVTYTDGEPEFSKKQIKKFIKNLASECNEYNESYNFTTSGGSQITVKGVTYGRAIDQDAMTKELKSALKEQKSKSLDMKWSQLKYNNGKGIGDSYIEISIPGQHVWCYKNGELVVDCACVTGAPGHDTARGVFFINYITGPTTLRGYNGDGTKYASPVNCFMPFYGGQGLHGSNGWRSQWGGEIYKTAGSHGCVNLPLWAAETLYDNADVGTPVFIY